MAEEGNFYAFPSALAFRPCVVPRHFYQALLRPALLPLPLLAALVFIIGCVSALRKKDARLLLIISPIFFALAASALHKYPFGRRLLLFAVPSLLIFIAEGTRCVMTRRRPYSTTAGLAVIAILLLEPFASASWNLIHPRTREEVRPVIGYMKAHTQPGDDCIFINGSTPPSGTTPRASVMMKALYRRRAREGDGATESIKLTSTTSTSCGAWIGCGSFLHVFTLTKLAKKTIRPTDGLGTRLDSFKRPARRFIFTTCATRGFRPAFINFGSPAISFFARFNRSHKYRCASLPCKAY